MSHDARPQSHCRGVIVGGHDSAVGAGSSGSADGDGPFVRYVLRTSYHNSLRTPNPACPDTSSCASTQLSWYNLAGSTCLVPGNKHPHQDNTSLAKKAKQAAFCTHSAFAVSRTDESLLTVPLAVSNPTANKQHTNNTTDNLPSHGTLLVERRWWPTFRHQCPR